MAATLTDGAPEDGAAGPARVEPVELLGEDEPLEPEPRLRLPRPAVVLALVVALAAGALAGARAQAWRQQQHEDGVAALLVQDVDLHLASFQLSSLEVTVHNTGPRPLRLEALSAVDGAVRPQDGVLPLELPAGEPVRVRLRFGDRCGTHGLEPPLQLATRVRSEDGRQHALDMAVVGDAAEVAYVQSAVAAACAAEGVPVPAPTAGAADALDTGDAGPSLR